jgi:citrate synthase
MFGVMLAIPRTSGWIADWLEMVVDAEQTPWRPQQIYTGPRDLSYRPLAER